MASKEIKIKCRDIKGKEYLVDSKKVAFRPSVYGILIKQNKILLSRQWDGYDFPGGGIKINETIREALKREFLEETGLRIKPKKLIECQTSFFITPFEEEAVNSILIYFLCAKNSGRISTRNFDKYEKKYAQKAEWIGLSEIENIKFCNSVDSIEIIGKALNNYKL